MPDMPMISKFFCRKRSDADKLFVAVKDWLKERLGLDISPEKSKIVNLRRQYSDFLGFKLKAVRKGSKANKSNKYAVESHMSDKAIRKVKAQARKMVKQIEYPVDQSDESKAIGAYNAYVSGVHNYYRYATHISKDIRKIAFGITRTMKNRLRNRLQVQGDTLPKYIAERYGNSKTNSIYKRSSCNSYRICTDKSSALQKARDKSVHSKRKVTDPQRA